MSYVVVETTTATYKSELFVLKRFCFCNRLETTLHTYLKKHKHFINFFKKHNKIPSLRMACNDSPYWDDRSNMGNVYVNKW